ncbi:MAG: hypothetical protein U9Q90_02595 [Campylobacterota bacterium]|nr:hypothetical protein [Campylobacterota bacterium]
MKHLLFLFFFTTSLFPFYLSDSLPKEAVQLVDSFDCFSKDDKTVLYSYILALKYRMDHADDREALVKSDLDYWRLWHLASDIENKYELNYQFSHILEETLIPTSNERKVLKKLRRIEGNIHTDGSSESSAKMSRYDEKLRAKLLLNPPKYKVLKKNPSLHDYNLSILKNDPKMSISKDIYNELEKRDLKGVRKDLLFRYVLLQEERRRNYDRPAKRRHIEQELIYLAKCQDYYKNYLQTPYKGSFIRKLADRVSSSTSFYPALKEEFLPKEIENYCEHNIMQTKVTTYIPKKEKVIEKKQAKVVPKLKNLTAFLKQYENDPVKKKYAKEYFNLMKSQLQKKSTPTPNMESLKLLRLKSCLVGKDDKKDFELILARVKDFRIEGLKETFYSNIFNSQRWWKMTIKMKMDAEGEIEALKHFFDCNATMLTLGKSKKSRVKNSANTKQPMQNATDMRNAVSQKDEILKYYAKLFENKPTPDMSNQKAIEAGMIDKKWLNVKNEIVTPLGKSVTISGLPKGGVKLTYRGIPKGKLCTDFIQLNKNDVIYFNHKRYRGLDYIMLNDHKIKLNHYVYKHAQRLCNERSDNTVSFVKEKIIKRHTFKGIEMASSYGKVDHTRSMDYRGADILMSPDKKRFAITSEAKLFDVETLSLMMDLNSGGGNDIRLAFSPDNRWLAVGNYHDFIALWDMKTLNRYQKIDTEDNNGYSSMLFLPDSKTLVLQLNSKIYFLDSQSQSILGTLTPKWEEGDYRPRILAVAHNPKKKQLYISNEKQIEIWDINQVDSPKYIAELKDKTGRRVSALKVDSRNENILISADNKGVKFWNIDKGKVIQRLIPDAHSEIRRIVMSDDNCYLLGVGKYVLVWELGSGLQYDILSGGNTDIAEDAIFLPNSHSFITIGSGSMDMPHMHLWEIKK